MKRHCFCLRCAFLENKQYFEEESYIYQPTNIEVSIIIYIPKYDQLDVTFRSPFIIVTALHVSGGFPTYHQDP
jgi:hypothetical protein